METSAGAIRPRIIASENLKQKDDNIHPSAIEWLTVLSVDIRRVLGQFSTIKSGIISPTPKNVPTNAALNPIAIPANLSPRDAKGAMVQTIVQKNISIDPARPQPSDGWEAIIDSLLKAQEPGYRSQFQTETHTNPALRSWYVESVESNAVVFGFRSGKHYMSVSMTANEGKIMPLIIMSENIMIRDDIAHPDAVQWITDLSVEIRKTLGEFSLLKHQFKPDVQDLLYRP
jgi:hypothetical protein